MERLEKEDIIEKIKQFIRCDNASEDSENYYFQIDRFSKSLLIVLNKHKFEDSCNIYFDMNQSKLGGLFSSNNYEIHVNSEHHHLEELPLILRDSENQIEYTLQQPSLVYIIYLILNITNPRMLIRIYSSYTLKNTERPTMDFEDFFYNVYRINSRIRTISIKSDKTMSESRFENLLQGFAFQLCYNLDVICIIPSSLDDFSVRDRFHSYERNPVEELEPPKRKYISKLINFYQQAMVADSAFLKYLAFYHVLEYFFDQVLFKELENDIKNLITDPGFSYKNSKKIKSLIKLITDTVKAQHEEYSFDERSSLQLVLEKYIDILELKDKLINYDNDLLDYYKNNKVTFSAGETVDLVSSDISKIYKNLSHRIYQTRCSLVHTKGFSEKKFIPFKNEKELLKEIPLIRFISEQIIIHSSEII